MCKLEKVRVPLYAAILNDDGRYYIYKWNIVKHQYEDVPLNKEGFLDKKSADQIAKSLNSEQQPLSLRLYVDKEEKSDKELSNKDS